MQRSRDRSRGGPANGAEIPTDELVHYLIDTTDANLVRVGTADQITGPELSDEAGSNQNGTDQAWTADADSAIFATIGAGPFSFFAFIKTAVKLAQVDIMGNGTGAAVDNCRLRYTTSGKPRFRINGTNYDMPSSADLSDDDWHCVAITSSGTGGTLLGYVDGAEVLNTTITTYALADSGSFDIGVTGSGGWWQGGLDGIWVFDRVLTAGEIVAMCNNVT